MGPNGGCTPFLKSIVQSYDHCFGNVSTYFFPKHIFVLFVLRRDFKLMWPNIWSMKNIDQEHILNNMHESLVPSNNLRHLDLHVLPKSSLCLKFCMHPSSCLFSVAQCTWSWFLLDIVVKVSHFGASCFCVSKWRFIVC